MVGPEENQTVAYPSLPASSDEEIHAWNYADRRQMQEVCANVFLGPYACAAKTKLDSLKVREKRPDIRQKMRLVRASKSRRYGPPDGKRI